MARSPNNFKKLRGLSLINRVDDPTCSKGGLARKKPPPDAIAHPEAQGSKGRKLRNILTILTRHRLPQSPCHVLVSPIASPEALGAFAKNDGHLGRETPVIYCACSYIFSIPSTSTTSKPPTSYSLFSLPYLHPTLIRLLEFHLQLQEVADSCRESAFSTKSLVISST